MVKEGQRAWQVRILGVLWLTYSLYYVGRMNLAVALPVIQEQFGFSTASLGMISSTFYWVYACGQLINGFLGDRAAARWFVCLGLLGTALCNFVFGLSTILGTALWVMALVWGLNGVFQSTGWGPIVKTASRWTTAEQRPAVSAFLSTSFVLGALASWWLSGRILAWTRRTELVFWIPAALLAIQALAWAALVRNDPREVGLAIPGTPSPAPVPSSLTLWGHLHETTAFIRLPSLTFLAVTTLVQGMIKEGINLWTPSLLMHSQDLDVAHAAAYSLVVPVMGFLGVLVAGVLTKYLPGERWGLTVLFSAGALLSVGVRYVINSGSPLGLSLVVGACSLVINGSNAVLLSTVPLKYGGAGKASTAAGYLDFASYIGSALMTGITGWVISVWGWSYIAPLWTILFVLAAATALVNKETQQVSETAVRDATTV